MKTLVPLLLLATAASAFGQVQPTAFGIFGVTRRVQMVVPQIQANQFFAAGGVYVATPANPGAVQPGAFPGQTQAIPVSGPLADVPPSPPAAPPRPVMVYRAPATAKPHTAGTNQITASVSSSTNAASRAVVRGHWAGDESIQPATPSLAASEH